MRVALRSPDFVSLVGLFCVCVLFSDTRDVSFQNKVYIHLIVQLVKHDDDDDVSLSSISRRQEARKRNSNVTGMKRERKTCVKISKKESRCD